MLADCDKVRLGVITLQNAPWRELVERWRTLERLGVYPPDTNTPKGTVTPGVFERAFAAP